MAAGIKTGGRTKGTPNKVTTQTAAKIAAAGLTPLDYMLSKLRDKESDEDTKRWAAQNAAPYVHPKLSAITADINATVDVRSKLMDLK